MSRSQPTIYIRRGDSIIGRRFRQTDTTFRDSVLNRTRDTLVFIDGDTLLIKPFVPVEVYKVSAYRIYGEIREYPRVAAGSRQETLFGQILRRKQ